MTLELPPGSLVSERYPLAEGPDAFTSLSERRGLKVVVEPQREDQRGAE